jgi:hypothetical protein
MALRELTAGLLVALGMLSPFAAWARDRSPSEILKNPDRFHEQSVVIAGTVSNVRGLVSARGNPYFTFDVDDGLRALSVLKYGTAPCEAGAQATVEGQFFKVAKQGQDTIRNQVRAYRVTCR